MRKTAKKKAKRRVRPRIIPIRVVRIDNDDFRKIATSICEDSLSKWAFYWRETVLSMVQEKIDASMDRAIALVCQRVGVRQ